MGERSPGVITHMRPPHLGDAPARAGGACGEPLLRARRCASLGCATAPSTAAPPRAGGAGGGRRWTCADCRARALASTEAAGARVLATALLHGEGAGGAGPAAAARMEFESGPGARVVLVCLLADGGGACAAGDLLVAWPPLPPAAEGGGGGGGGGGVAVCGRAVRPPGGAWPPAGLLDVSGQLREDEAAGGSALKVATFQLQPAPHPLDAGGPPAARLVVALQLLGGAPSPASHRAAVLARGAAPRAAFAHFAAASPVARDIPLGGPQGPLRVPVRGEACAHAEALDLDAYLAANAAPGARWVCPLCVRDRAACAQLLPPQLWVDPFLDDALRWLATRGVPAEAVAARALRLVPGEPWRLWPPLGAADAAAGAAAIAADAAAVTCGVAVAARIGAATAEAARQEAAAAAAARRP